MNAAMPSAVHWKKETRSASSTPSRQYLRSISSASFAIDDVIALRAEILRLQGENQTLRAQTKRAVGFAHRVAHDLKGPARKIAAFSRLLQGTTSSQQAGHARAHLGLERNVETLRQTIEEYLMASVSESKAADVSVDNLIEKVIEPLRAIYPNVDVTVASFGNLRTHPTALRRILHNVLDNAFKFDDRASTKNHRVHIDGQRRGDLFVITVDDNGCGQSQSVNHPARGHGIGLASLQTDLDDLGGTLCFRDWPTGTRSEIRLPL